MQELNFKASEKINELTKSLPEAVLNKHFQLDPGLKKKYNARMTNLYLEDTRYHLAYLAETVKNDEQVLFNEYIEWIKVFFSNLPVEDQDLILNFELIRDYISDNLAPEYSALINRYLYAGIKHFKSFEVNQNSFIVESNPLNKLASSYLDYLISSNKKGATNLIMDAFKNGIAIKDLYLNVFQPVQKETGRLWQTGKINVAQEHFNTAVSQLIMSQFYPYIFNETRKEKKIIVTCINGELHEIGARMVADLFEMDGWDSYYYGANNPQTSLLSSIVDIEPDIIAISATMTFNISEVEKLIGQIKKQNNGNKLKILVGGNPFNIALGLWKKLGADGCANNAASAIELANRLIN